MSARVPRILPRPSRSRIDQCKTELEKRHYKGIFAYAGKDIKGNFRVLLRTRGRIRDL